MEFDLLLLQHKKCVVHQRFVLSLSFPCLLQGKKGHLSKTRKTTLFHDLITRMFCKKYILPLRYKLVFNRQYLDTTKKRIRIRHIK